MYVLVFFKYAYEEVSYYTKCSLTDSDTVVSLTSVKKISTSHEKILHSKLEIEDYSTHFQFTRSLNLTFPITLSCSQCQTDPHHSLTKTPHSAPNPNKKI